MPNRYAAVQELLDTLRAARCSKAKVEMVGGEVCALDVEFAPDPAPVSPFVDASGKPVDLDEGAGPLTRDPGSTATADDADTLGDIERKNLQKRDEAASS